MARAIRSTALEDESSCVKPACGRRPGTASARLNGMAASAFGRPHARGVLSLPRRHRSARQALLGVVVAAGCLSVPVALPPTAHADGQFPVLQSGFNQALYATAPAPGSLFGGVAFAPNGDPWVDGCVGSGGSLIRFDSTTTTAINGSSVHPQLSGSPFVSNAGCGLTNAPNGELYSNTEGGASGLDALTGTALATSGPPGNVLGITVDPVTNNLVYVAADCRFTPTCTIESLDAASGISTVFATLSKTDAAFVDGIAFDPIGCFLFLANRAPSFRVTILNRSGAIVQHIPMTSEPDGLSFHGTSPKFVVTNNTDGTMTRLDFPGDDYTQPPVPSVFASGGSRGDQTQVGPDNCIYTTQEHTRYDNGVEDVSQNSLVRICPGFAPPPGVTCPTGQVRDANGLCNPPPPPPPPAASHHYRVELKAWIPFQHVVDPEMVFEPTSYLLNRDLFGESVCQEASFFAQYLTNLISVYRGDGHSTYAGGFRVLSALEFDWNGSQITGFHEASGPHYGTTHRDINQNGPDGAFSCSEDRTATSAVRVQQNSLQAFAMSIDSKNPIPPQDVTPSIDSTLTGTFGAGGALTFGWQSDLFPSHGFYVEEDGHPAITAVTNDPSSCMSESDARGPLWAQRLAFGLLHPDNTGSIMLPANTLGQTLNLGSLLCSENIFSTSLPNSAATASAAHAATTRRGGHPRVTASRLVNGKQSPAVGLLTAASQGWLSLVKTSGGDDIYVLSASASPIVLHISGVPFTVTTIGPTSAGKPQAYFPKGTVTAALGRAVLVKTTTGRRLSATKLNLAPPVVRARVLRSHGMATVTFVVTSAVPVKALRVSVGGGHFRVLRGRRLRVPVRKLHAVAYYGTNVLGTQGKVKVL
jgi:hypothetical protein